MADYLTDEEQAERLKAWWDKNGTSLLIALVVAIAVVVGWRYYQTYTTDRANAASEVFRSYLEARAQAEPVNDYLETIDNEHEGSSYHVFTLLYRAADQVQEQDWEEALALLERGIELADERNLKDSARYRAAKVLYELDRLDRCTAQLAEITSPGLRAQVAELSGDVAFAQGDIGTAREAYQAAVDAARRDPRNVLPGTGLMELKLASLVQGQSLPDGPRSSESAAPAESAGSAESTASAEPAVAEPGTEDDQ